MDSDLRDLERQWLASRSGADEERFVRALVRSGDASRLASHIDELDRQWQTSHADADEERIARALSLAGHLDRLGLHIEELIRCRYDMDPGHRVVRVRLQARGDRDVIRARDEISLLPEFDAVRDAHWSKPRFFPCTTERARTILMSALHQQMAYQYDLMPLEVAEKIAIRFCGLFSTSYQAFSQKPQSEDIAAGVVGTFGYVLPNTFSD